MRVPNRSISALLVGVLALAGCSKPSPKVLLQRIAAAHEDYDLEVFYSASRQFLEHHGERPERDRVRYDMAEQMVATNLRTPDSALAHEARRHLEQASTEARTKSDRFDAALLLMKFTPDVDVRAEAERMTTTYDGHPGLQQVYFWAIGALVEKRDLQGAAEFARGLLQRYPEIPNPETYRAIIRRSELAGKLAPFGPAATASIGDALADKVVLVDFWATWCGPCIAALPKIVAFHRENAARGFELVQVSLDEDREAYEAFLREHPHAGVQLRSVGDDGVDERFGVRVLPAYFILDREGRVHASDVPRAELFPIIDELLARDHKKTNPSPR